jgi:hypothetical protein
MADNVAITAGAGTVIATDDVGSVQFQRIKNDVGGDGVSVPVLGGRQSAAAGTMAVTLSAEDFAVLDGVEAATSTLVCAARTGRRSVTVEQLGTTAVYIGATGVTSATGALLPGVAGSSITLSVTGAIYGIAASGTQAVAVIELF